MIHACIYNFADCQLHPSSLLDYQLHQSTRKSAFLGWERAARPSTELSSLVPILLTNTHRSTARKAHSLGRLQTNTLQRNCPSTNLEKLTQQLLSSNYFTLLPASASASGSSIE